MREVSIRTVPEPITISAHRIHPDTKPGYVHLKVSSLENQLTFYQQVLGLKLHWSQGKSAGLGAGGKDLLRLTEIANGRRYQRVTGMYHFAILFPNQRELARAIARLFTLKYPNYPTDHIMTKTTYLDDPEGNNIELYAESPEDGIFIIQEDDFLARRADGSLSNGREPLDLDALFAHLSKDDRLDQPFPPETRLGHFHLYVANLEETKHFYHDLLGFDFMGLTRSFRMGMVSAGGYHHHIGFNTWQGEAAPPPPMDALGLRHISFTFPNTTTWEQFMARIEEIELPYNMTDEGILLSDPSENTILFIKPE